MPSSGKGRRGTAPKCPKCAQFYKKNLPLSAHRCARAGWKPGMHHPPEVVARVAAKLRGYKHTPEARANMSVSAQRRSARGPREFNSSESMEKSATTRRGRPTAWFQTPEAIRKRAEATARAERERKSSSIELTVRVALAAMGIRFIRSYPVESFIVDIYVPDLLLAIECDGSYWHAGEALKHDARKDAALRAAGLTVLRLAESEIRSGAFYERLCAACGQQPNSIDGEPARVNTRRA
jgi:very-short-patch-repair endonuclease